MKATENTKKMIPVTADYVPKHDLVFGSPINDPVAGIPLGDGDTGSLVWFEADGIHIHINKTDLWDDSTMESEYICSGETENLTCLRHGGEIVIRFGVPCFDMIYQKEFEARLCLGDATLRINAQTPFSHVQAECFASNGRKTTALRCKYALEEMGTPEITLLRWGSRNYWRWYYLDRCLPESGLAGTQTQAENGRLYICQELKGTRFCLGLAVVSEKDCVTKRKNRHAGSISFGEASEGSFTLYWNISLGKTTKEAKEKTKFALDLAAAEELDAMHQAHADQWAEFWNKSFVSIPQDYIENCYYLSLYYANSQCRGAYPPLFTNGIWGFRHDFYPWAYYFHYNMQHMYGPLEPSGHGELAVNYYRMRRNGLAAAYQYAEKAKGKKGAFYHDVTDRYGRSAKFDSDNCTPGPQLAMAMYRHWRMNGDDRFLRETALPVMKGAAEFYLDILKKEADGLYHIHGTTAYEGTPPFHDTITDLVMIRALFGTLKAYVSEEERRIYEDILSHLPEYSLVPMDADEKKGDILQYGIGKGRPVQGSGMVLSVGKDDDGNPVRKNRGDLEKCIYGFPDTEMSPLYPAGIFGLKDKGSLLFDAMTNQILLHPEICMCWCMMPLYLARMGMAADLYRHMETMIRTWLIYPNGLGTERTYGGQGCLERLRYNDVLDLGTGTLTKMEEYGFQHFDMETLPIVAHGVCESLLQSYDGVLRICPAVDKEASVRFCLYGEGGFKVSCNAAPDHFCLTIESLRGEICRVKLPEHIAMDSICVHLDGKQMQAVWENAENETYLMFETPPAGSTIVITDGRDFEPDEFACVIPNACWKTCGNVHLGTPAISGKGKEDKTKWERIFGGFIPQ